MNSPKLKQRRWNGGELLEEDSTSPGTVWEKRRGGIIGEGVGRRRASAPAWSKSTAVEVLCSLGPAAERRR
jgi:hypothetical protein